MKRRKKGTGTIERTSDGQFRARFPFEVGGRTDVGVFGTYDAAALALDAIVIELHAAGRGQGRSLRKVVEKTHAQRRAAGYASSADDEQRWRTYFDEHELADAPVHTISEGEVVDAILAFRHHRTGLALALSTRKNILNMLRAAFEVAKRDDLVTVNVLATTTFPDPKGKGKKAARKVRRRALSWDAHIALRKASKDADEIVVGIWTGMRQGELRALHWPDVHNVGGVPCVCEEHRAAPHIVVRYGKPPTEAMSADDDCSPKNGEVRVVSLWGPALKALERRHRGGPENVRQIVFVSRLNGYRPKGKLVSRKRWSDWKRDAGLALRYHDLRHTCGTWLVRGELRMGIAASWPLEAVKEHLGHAELRTTELYADQRDGEQAAAHASRALALEGVSGFDKPGDKPEAVEKLSHLRGLNSRPTVYEHDVTCAASQDFSAIRGLATGVLIAAATADAHALPKAIELAREVLRALPAADAIKRAN